MKKAIVPLLVILLIVVSVFIYINRFSVYYVADDNSYVFEDDTLASNLTNGVTKDSDEVTIKKVGISENIYSSNKKYYVGESSKKSVSLDYPIVSEDNSKLYIQTDLGKYVDSTFAKSDVLVNSVLADATLYNGVNNVQVDDMSYYFLELNNGIHINLVRLTIATSRKTYEIPVNSYIYFGESFLRYYFRNSKGDFSYREIPAISDVDNVTIGDESYTYRDFLLLLGVAYVDIVNDGDRNTIEAPTVDDEDPNQGEDTLKKRGKIVQAERYIVGGDVEGEYYVDPEVHINSFKSNVYSVTFDLDIYDPANRINKPPTLTFLIDGKPYMKKSYSTSGSYIVTGLRPDTEYELQVEYRYKNRLNIQYVDYCKRIFLNSQKLEDLGEPFTYTFRTRDISELNDVVFKIPSIVPGSKSVVLNSLSLVNSVGDEVLNGIKEIKIHFNDSVVKLSTPEVFSLTKGNAIDYDSKDILKSNTQYDCYFEVIDIADNVLRVTNNRFNFKTLKAPPSAIASVIKSKQDSIDFKQKKVTIDFSNPDDVSIINSYRRNNIDYKFKIDIVKLVGGTEHVVYTDYFNVENERKDNLDITVYSLESNTKYYINVYCSYYDDYGNLVTGKINPDASFTTSEVSELGTIAFKVDDLVNNDASSVSFRLQYTSMKTSDDIFDLLHDTITFRVKRKDNGQVIYENEATKWEFLENSAEHGVSVKFCDDDLETPCLFSNTTYVIEVVPYVQDGSNLSQLKSSVNPSEFTTSKNEAQVVIQNPFKASGYMDFDICILDPDGAVIAEENTEPTVQVSLYNESKLYYTTAVPVSENCDGGFVRKTIKDMDPTLQYNMIVTASKYSTSNNTNNADTKDLYNNLFTLDGTSGVINLNKMIDTVAYDLDEKSVDLTQTQPDGVNVFDITNTTRWKGSGSANSYDLKSLLIDTGIVEFGSYQGGYRSYAYYIPELKGKPFSISFESNVSRSKGSLNASEEFFCINNGYTSGNTCNNQGTTGTGNIMSSLINTNNNGYKHRFAYTFNSLNSTGYITFFVKDTSSQIINTTVSLKNLKIEYGPNATDFSGFGIGGNSTSQNQDSDTYITEYVGFFDSKVEVNSCTRSGSGVCGIEDGSDALIKAEGTESTGNAARYSGKVIFNGKNNYSYYLRFFQEGIEIPDLRMNVEEEAAKDLENDPSLQNVINLVANDYKLKKDFLLNGIDSDSSYEVRLTIVVSDDPSSETPFTPDINEINSCVNKGDNKDHCFRFHDIYSYEFTSEIESRSIETVQDFMNMHSYGNYIVVNDLDFTGVSSSVPFSGTFHGSIDFQGHKVTVATGSGFRYLFGAIGGGGRVKNLDLHIIFNNTNSMSGFHGITDDNYGQITNLMITTVNDTTDPDVYSQDPDLSLLSNHVDFDYNKIPVQGDEESDDAYNSRYKDFVKRFSIYYSSLVAETNMGLIDKFAINLKSPLYFHFSSSLIVQPYDANGINQGTIRNGYVYGQDIVSLFAMEGGSSRNLAIFATSAKKNAVIENVYSLINIRMYDNNIAWSENRDVCVMYEYTYYQNDMGEYTQADGETLILDEAGEPIVNPEEQGGVVKSKRCIQFGLKRSNSNYNAALVLNSTQEAIIKNIISFGDILGYSSDTYDQSNGDTLPNGAVSQQALIDDIYNRDSSILGSTNGSNISNIYNITRFGKTYSGAVSESINKLYFKDKNFIDEILNTHEAFKTYEAWAAGTYPQLDWPEVMPAQFVERVDSSRLNEDKYEIMSVDSVEQDSSKFAGSYGTKYRNYFAEVKLSVYTPNTNYRIKNISIDGINVNNIDNIKVVHAGTDLTNKMEIYYLYIKEPYTYKNQYTIKDIYYVEDKELSSAVEKSCSNGEAGALPCMNGQLDILVDLPLYKSVGSFNEINSNIANGTTNFILNKDLDCSVDDCTSGGKLPYINEVKGVINGNGHIIKNLEANNCLIGTLSGTIKNLRIEGYETHFVNGGNTFDSLGSYGGFVCVMNNAAVIDNLSLKDVNVGAGGNSDIYIGGVVALSNGGFIRNTSINGFAVKDDNLKHMQNANAYIGGLVGKGANLIINNDFVRNVNLVVQKYSSDTWGPKDAAAVGGIIGYLDFGNIEDVYSTGDITTAFANTGGIAGISGGYIKNCISKLNIVGTDYIGTITGKVDDKAIPSSKVAKSLALGDILTTTGGANVARTTGSIISMNGNYAWDRQSVNSVYTQNTDGESLLSVEEMINPLVFSNRIGLSNENWVLSSDYSCKEGYSLKEGESLCSNNNDTYFANGFRYAIRRENMGGIVKETQFGYIPMIRNTETGEPLYNQGYYEGEAGYSDADRTNDDNKLRDLEIRFVEMFTITGLNVAYKQKGNEIPLSESERYRADYADIEISMYNPNNYKIWSMNVDGTKKKDFDNVTDIVPEVSRVDLEGNYKVTYKAIPEKFLNSYLIDCITYSKSISDDNYQKYTVPLKVEMSFYGKINSVDDWNNIPLGKSQNYLVESDIDFGCTSASTCNVKTGLSFNVLRGRKTDGTKPTIKNIMVDLNTANTGLIDNVAVSFSDIDFENVSLTTSGSGTYFGLVKTLDGPWQPTLYDNIGLKNIKISAPNVNCVGIIANDRASLIRDINVQNVYVRGKDETGGFVGHSELKDKININMTNVYVVGQNDVGGFIGYEKDAGARYYDRDITINGAYVKGSTYVGGIVGLGTIYRGTITGKNENFNTSIGDAPAWLKASDAENMTLNIVTSNGNYVGGSIGSTYGDTSYYNRVRNMNISSTGSYVGGVAGSSRNVYYSESDHNNVSGAAYVGGVVGHTGWGVHQNIVVTNKVIATSHSAGAVTGGLGWCTAADNQVSVSNDTESNFVKAPHYAGGVVGLFTSSHGTIRDNVTNAVVATTDTTGGAGGVIGYIPNDNETSSDAYRYWVYRNVVTNAVVGSNSSHAGGLIGGWRRDARVNGRIYNNTISASVLCKDTTFCGLINGGSYNGDRYGYELNSEGKWVQYSGGYNGDLLASAQYRFPRNANHPYASTWVSTTYKCPSGYSGVDAATIPANQSPGAIASATCYKYAAVIDETYLDDEGNVQHKPLTCPRGYNLNDTSTRCVASAKINSTKNYKCDHGGSVNSSKPTQCDWWYNEYDRNYSEVYTGISINEESIVGQYTGDISNISSLSISSSSPLKTTTVYGTNYLRDELKWSKSIDNLSYTADVTGLGNSTYFPYSSYASVPLTYGGSTPINLPNEKKTKKLYHAPQLINNQTINALQLSTVPTLPLVNVYASDVDKINVEFSKVDPAVSFSINGNTYSVNKQTYTFYYDFEDDFEIELNNSYLTETITISADDITNNSTTIGDEFYYIDEDGNVITNGTLKSNGYENKPEIVEENDEEEEEEPNPENQDGSSTEPQNQIDLGLTEMSNGNSRGVIYKLVDSSERTTEIDNANNIFGDEILLDNKNIYNISTGKTTINDFENLTLVEDEKPLYEFTYAGQNIKTFATYSIVDGEVVKKQLIVKNNKLEIIENGLDAASNSYLVDSYNDKEYVIYLGKDGKIHSLKDKLTLPKGFKNINIKSISSTVGTNTNVLLVEYKDGSYVVFNYRNGNVISNQKSSNMSLGEYIKQYLQLTFDDNNYTDENEDYLEARELVNKLNKNSIDSVLGDYVNTDSSATSNSTYSIAYNPYDGGYSVYQLPLSESNGNVTVSESLVETVDQKIDRDGKLISFYREADSTKVTFVSAMLIVIGIVSLIGLAVFILAKYLKKHQL